MNYRKLYEKELARANRNAVAFHMLRREVEHASKIANELHHSMERDCMGLHLQPYMQLAIIANKQAVNAAYMASIRETAQ